MRGDFGGLSAGELRHRVTWQQSKVIRTPVGQDKATWTTVGTFWARVEPLSGRELFNAQQIKAVISHRITMRNVGSIAPDDRLLFEGTNRTFNVEVPTRRDEQNVALDLLCSELVAQ